MKWLLSSINEMKWTIKWLMNYGSIFFKRIWRPWGTRGKRMTFRQALVYSKTLADTLETIEVLDLKVVNEH